jgi:hypothetical protein
VWEKRDQSTAVNLFAELGDEGVAPRFKLVASTNADLRVYRVNF